MGAVRRRGGGGGRPSEGAGGLPRLQRGWGSVALPDVRRGGLQPPWEEELASAKQLLRLPLTPLAS